MSTSSCTSGSSVATVPCASSDSDTRIEVSGVRNSCEAVAMNSSFMRSTFLRSEISLSLIHI